MKKLVRRVEFNYSFILIGVCCRDEDYRLCWQLNQSLEMDFERVDDLIILNEADNVEFSVFEYLDEESDVSYHIINNKNNGMRLIPEERKIDFFLKISGETQTIHIPDTIKKLREMPSVIAVFLMEPEKMKSLENLLF